jgi:hypothetical protein
MAGDAEKVRHPIFARICVREGARAERKGQGRHRKEFLAGLIGRVVEAGAGPG